MKDLEPETWERVAVGLAKADACRVIAISHTATFDARSDFITQLADAMNEVLDLDQALVHPPLDEDAVGGLAQAALSSARADAAVLSVPLANDRDRVGVLTLERAKERPFGPDDLQLCEAIGQLLGPVVEVDPGDHAAQYLGRPGDPGRLR